MTYIILDTFVAYEVLYMIPCLSFKRLCHGTKMGNLLLFIADFFATQIIGGALELVVLL